MNAPATRAELREELANYPTKADLANFATRADLDLVFGAFYERMLAEMASLHRGTMEGLRIYFVGLDDRYADLPVRVTRLEALVLPPDE